MYIYRYHLCKHALLIAGRIHILILIPSWRLKTGLRRSNSSWGRRSFASKGNAASRIGVATCARARAMCHGNFGTTMDVLMIYDDLWWFGKYKMDQNAWHFDPTCFFAPSPTETPFLSLRLYFFPTPHWGPLFQSLFTVFLVPSNIETLCLSLCLRFLGSKPHREPLFKPVFALFLAACPTETPCLRWLSLCLQFLYLLFFFVFLLQAPLRPPVWKPLFFIFFALSPTGFSMLAVVSFAPSLNGIPF